MSNVIDHTLEIVIVGDMIMNHEFSLEVMLGKRKKRYYLNILDAESIFFEKLIRKRGKLREILLIKYRKS